jgi:hypothetical protein
MKKTIQLQQGDVWVESCDLPHDAVENKFASDIVTLAWGTATGHSHSITDATGIKVFTCGDRKFLLVEEPTTLKHQEHLPINVPAGTYEYGRVFQRDHLAGLTTAVAD